MAKYRLQALLEIRERAEEAAKEAFARAMKALEAEQAELQARKDRLAEMIQAREDRQAAYQAQLASGALKIRDQSGVTRYLKRMKDEEAEQGMRIAAQAERVEEAEAALRSAQEALVRATQDLKALLKHKENWQTAKKKLRQQREEDQLDEIAQTIFQQQSREQGP